MIDFGWIEFGWAMIGLAAGMGFTGLILYYTEERD